MSIGWALPTVAVSLLSLALALVLRAGRAWCCGAGDRPLATKPAVLSADDLAAVARDEDLDAVIAQLERLHADVDAIEDKMRREVAATGRNYDAWATEGGLSSKLEREQGSKLAALRRLRDERRGGGTATAPAPRPPANSVPTRVGGVRTVGSAADADAAVAVRAAADARAFAASPYTRKWRQWREAPRHVS